MSSVEEIFAEYVLVERQGEGDPRPYLKRLEGDDRERLGEMIDAYLAAAPGQEWDPQAFQGSPAARAAESIGRAINGVSGTWPVVLPGLRERARIKRSELVDRLAERLGFPGQREAVDEYYHRMEYGTLESDGVSDQVLDALGQILGSGRNTLRRSGELIGGGRATQGIVFARQATQADEAPGAIDHATDQAETGPSRSPGSDPDREAVARLFTGGA